MRASISLLGLICAAAACTNNGGGLPVTVDSGVPPDLAAPPDLRLPIDLSAPKDLTPPPPDLFSTDVTQAQGSVYKFVTSALLAPQLKTDYALDLNGDGKVDNQLGNVIGALASQNFDVQSGINDAIAAGGSIELLAVQSTDPMLQNAQNAGVTLHRATVAPNPDFSGNGTFTVDNTVAAAQFFGHIAGGRLSSNNPATTTHPVVAVLSVPIFPGAAPVPLRLQGAHVQVQSSNCPPHPTTNKIPQRCGQIHGSIRKEDIKNDIYPALAKSLSAKIASDPNSNTAQQLRNIFDVGDGMGGNCTSLVDGAGKPGDGVISVCEVEGNAIIGNILVPDVDIFADDGVTYAPNPKNVSKDSMSVGFGFELVPAKF